MRDAADYVVVGSGAAGATAALILAEAGREVVVLEEGPALRPDDRGLGAPEALLRHFRDAGTQVAVGRSVIPVLQGRCVGGTTVLNGAIVWRIPEDAHHRCFVASGMGDAVPLLELERCWARIERELSIAPTPDHLLGNNGALMRRAADVLGYRGHAIRRNVRDCAGSGRCLEGCPTARKQSMEQTYLPRAMARGARVYAEHLAARVLTEGGRARRVIGRAPGGAFEVEARRGVVLAASAVQSPGLLARSGLGSRRHTGQHFRAHPGAAVIGIYPQPVRLWEGGTQTYELDHFRADGGFKLETLSLPLELAGVRSSALGPRFAEVIADYGHMAVWGAQVRAEAEGRVRSAGARAQIRYTPSPADMARFRRAAQVMAEMHFAAGAARVLPGIHGLPESIDRDGLAQLAAASLDPRDWSLVATHLFGTCRMAHDARDGVVDARGRVHGVDGLWVVDSSIFPNNLGVNPQHAIMGVAMLLAERIAAD